MAECPNCHESLEYVDTELIELRGYDEVVGRKEEESQAGNAVATVCPECDVLLDL